MTAKAKKTKDIPLPLDASILDGLPDPVFLVDQAHLIVDCNRAGRRLLGGEAVGCELAKSLNNNDVITAVENTLDGNPGTRTEVFIPYPVSHSYELNVWRLPDLKSKGPAWAMVVLQDITAAKKAEQMRADFVANVSHELRSPLSSLLGFIETLRGPAKDDKKATEKFLAIMETEAKRMTRLINDLLALSKVETDEHIRPEETLDLGKLLAQITNILSVRAKERGMDINLDLPEPLPPVIGDADELTQVFQNLINNAISYGRAKTSVRIVAKAEDSVPGTGAKGLSVAVINEGEGIPAEDIPRLTERFYRVDKGRSRSMGGTGLGLAIVKHIVARHRGDLVIESAPGKKTSFRVHLQRAD
ncbi:MAG: PAS domain-containing protein [Rhodospirillales bacterium]|nr:PAS domain-containing protein [Rhodospirillales bacterium]